jgi:hypothetical protein
MPANILDEYLVKLGAVVDQAGLNRFNAALDAVRKNTEWGTAAMARSMGTAAKEIIVGLAAIGAATVGLLDHVANADQQYRLFSMHMFMNKDAARSLKITMDALGESLDNITWDPELSKRASQLFEDQRRMVPNGDFEGQMHKIRDIRFQFTRMEVELKYLGMHVAMDFMKALGMGPDDLLKKLEKFNKWVQTHLPEISNRIMKTIIPLGKEIWKDVKAIGSALKQLGLEFTNFVGILDDDPSMQGAEFSFEKFSKASHRMALAFKNDMVIIGNSLKVLANAVEGSILVLRAEFYAIKAVATLNAGDLVKATEFAQLAWVDKDPVQVTDPSKPNYLPPPTAKGEVQSGALGNNPLNGQPVQGDWYSRSKSWWNTPLPKMGDKTRTTWKAFEAAMGNALRTPLMMVPTPGLMGALGSVESGGTKNPDTAVSSSGAIGRYQLMPGTAKMLGVDPWDPAQNKAGAYKYMSQLLKKYRGDVAQAVGAYHSGPGNIDAALAGKATLGPEGRGEISKVLGRMNRGSSVTVDTINVHITEPHATKEHIQMAVAHGVREGTEKQTQRNLAEWDTLGWGYGQ